MLDVGLKEMLPLGPKAKVMVKSFGGDLGMEMYLMNLRHKGQAFEHMLHHETANAVAPIFFKHRHAFELCLMAKDPNPAGAHGLAVNIHQKMHGLIIAAIPFFMFWNLLAFNKDQPTNIPAM